MTTDSPSFNPHANLTADGVLIAAGLRVFTNNLDRGVVASDKDAARCTCLDHPSAQMRVGMGWFTDHRAGDACPGCRHNHWFTVTLDNGGVASMDGERMATRFEGQAA